MGCRIDIWVFWRLMDLGMIVIIMVGISSRRIIKSLIIKNIIVSDIYSYENSFYLVIDPRNERRLKNINLKDLKAYEVELRSLMEYREYMIT